MNKITVVIPNYNGKDYLENCLKALYRQEAGTPPFEVLVVDNASGDGSVERAREWLEEKKESADFSTSVTECRFICLEQNTGFCHAVNVGITNSHAPYVILLNNDTKVKPGYVKALYRTIERHPRAFSVSAKMLMWDRPDLLDDAGDLYNVLGWAFAPGKGKKADGYNRVRRVFAACGGAAIYRRSILEEIGLFDEQHFAYLEDIDIGYRARIYGYVNLYEPRAQVLHYGSASTGSRYNPFKTRTASANNLYMIYKNMPLGQLLWNSPFLALGMFIKWLFFCKKGMGSLYLAGLCDGVKRCMQAEGKAHKVRFQRRYLGNYLRIQMELYGNTIFFFFQ
ncbi:MAG: glycosyltransferase family 2 protein [Lachnospiraceae bacterium]|nr:glycosyltransferase family 2 protein [Lachnospiraceae bacterium]